MSAATPEQAGYSARCSCCGHHSRFECNHYSFREAYVCTHCNASLRYRAQAESIVRCFETEGATCVQQLVAEAAFQSMHVYEPGVAGPFRKYFRNMPNYQQSFYWPDVALGESRDGVRCENLEQLSYNDERFDLVISSDIFEHVRKPMQAFGDIHRVLRPGGAHIFSIPVENPMPAVTSRRVDVSGSDDVHVLPAHYHGDGAGGKSLVYNDFGADLIRQLNDMGYLCETERPAPLGPAASRTVTFICWKL